VDVYFSECVCLSLYVYVFKCGCVSLCVSLSVYGEGAIFAPL